jgi:peptidoglycan/LPS O-acetylase OafA/YrhL
MQASVKSDYHYYEGLDAWRGIAVLIVMFAHYFITTSIGQLGWVVVEMFFVLSGFLITGILLKAKQYPKTFFRYFYIRRALRIVPFYFLFLTAFYISIFVFKRDHLLHYYTENWGYYYSFLQNWLFSIKGLPAEYYLNHLWSLSVEEQFYILWPFIIFYIPEKYLLTFLVSFTILICAIRVILWFHYPYEIGIYYCNTFTRIDSICLGCILATHGGIKQKYLSKILQIICLVIIASAIVAYKNTFFTNPFFATIGYTIVAFYFFLLLDSYVKSKRASFIKRNWFFNNSGKISYSMYLIHMPIYLLIKAKIPNHLLAVFVSFVFTYLLSMVIYQYFELKFLNLKQYFVPGKTVRKLAEPLTT